MRVWSVAIFAAIMAFSGGLPAARAEGWRTVAELQTACRAWTSGTEDELVRLVRRVQCNEFIDAFTTGFRGGEAYHRQQHAFCLPAGYSVGMLSEAFLAWARANPQDAEEPAAIGLLRALSSAFPCR